MADWWHPKSTATMPLGGDWWNSANAGGGDWWNSANAGGGNGAPAPARSLDFKAPGAGLQNAGITERNMYPRSEKLRGLKDQKEGGNRQLWKNLDRWESTPNAQNVDAEQKKLFDQYHATGERDPRLKDTTVATALDWGVREGTRSQVHKKSFLTSTLGKLLVGAGQIGLSFVPGVGPALSAGLGGVTGAMNGGGPLGALTGAVSGYGIGKGTQFLSNGIQHGFGALNNVNAFMPGDIAARAGSGAANTSFSLGTTGRAVEKSASAAAKALRARKAREEAEKSFRRQLAGP